MDVVDRFQLRDVHELAQRIGAEFKQIIEEYGGTCVSRLLPVVTDSLEHLESHVEENKRLRAANCQLILENDRLARERQHNLQALKQMEELQSKKAEFEALLGSLPEHSKLSGSVGATSVPEVALHRRLSAHDQATVQSERAKQLESENKVLRHQLEECKAEMALLSYQSTVESIKDEFPKFYKKDLLVVLRERNELKEELVAVQDELAMVKQDVKLCEACGEPVRSPDHSRTDTTVRHILSESVQLSDFLPPNDPDPK